MHTDPHSIVVDALGRLERALGGKDVDGAAACFVPDGALFGSGVGEDAHGRAELVRSFALVVDRGLSPRWELDDSYVRLEEGSIWFVADATVAVDVLGRRTRRRRFKMSGSLRGGAGYYRFELFNGLDPILSSGLHLVG
ncbi:nuclear transport factor 2 family protein [Nocardioides sp.]|uniref:nuclear transport factor 2 family protein n=1 Tax=Nocardioides sp. TaxID=35761 RepID=UPI00238DE4D7|nr:nuclear transport factor 2 family protein [Nocardioides sp.]MDE0777108.1 nuclear transport factor 2 family protein [Nocardioides sp.]